MIRNSVDIEKLLMQSSDVEQSKFNGGRYNKTTVFLLPMLNMSHRMRAMAKYLKNAFLDDGAVEHDFKRPIFLLMKVKDYKDKDWIDFCKSVLTTEAIQKSYLMDYSVGREDEHDLVMYVFEVPDKWTKDLEMFKEGRYSKMSDEYKRMFPQYVYLPGGDKRESQQWGAMNKSEALKDAIVKEFINPGTSTADDVISLRRDMNNWDEIWDAPQLKEEVFRLKSIYADTDTTTASEVVHHRADSQPSDKDLV